MAKKFSRPSASTIDYIAKGETQRVHRELRDAMAIVLGPPITSCFLGGEERLVVPPLRWPPSGTWLRLEMPYDMLRARSEWAEVFPPYCELVAQALGRELKAALNRDETRQLQPWPDLENATRFLLSVVFWREYLFEGQRHGEGSAAVDAEGDRFAYHLAEALRALLGPWLRGDVRTRRNLIRKAAFELDRVADTNEEMAEERHDGRFADLAIRDSVNGFVGRPSEELRQLVQHLKRVTEEDRRRGMDERESARRVLDGVSVSDEDDEFESET